MDHACQALEYKMVLIANSRLGSESCDVIPEELKTRRCYSFKVQSKDIAYGLGKFLYLIEASGDG